MKMDWLILVCQLHVLQSNRGEICSMLGSQPANGQQYHKIIIIQDSSLPRLGDPACLEQTINYLQNSWGYEVRMGRRENRAG